MTDFVDLSALRATWTRRYGSSYARRALPSEGALDAMPRQVGLAYGSRRAGRDQQDPDDQASGLGQIKVFLKIG